MRTIIPHDAHFVPKQAKRVFQGVIYDVYHWDQDMFDGSKKTFEMLKRPDTVKVICVHDGKIIAISDEQPGVRKEFTLPGGRHDIESETELDCAKREVREEIGMEFKNWKLLDAHQTHTKIEHVVYFFLASGLVSQQQAEPDTGGEKIVMHEISFEEAKTPTDEGLDKWWPTDIFARVNSLQELLDLPEYRGA